MNSLLFEELPGSEFSESGAASKNSAKTPLCNGSAAFLVMYTSVALEIVPIGVAIAIASLRLRHLFRKSYRVFGTGLLVAKLAAWLTLGIVKFILTALWALPLARRTRASIAANALTGAGALVLSILSYAEHTRSIKPSFLIGIYLFVSLLFDIAHVRTLWLRQDDWEGRAIAIVSSVAVGTKFILLLLESIEKRRILRPEYKNSPPEATAGIFNRSFFLWLNPLFKKGFSQLMTVDDLFAIDKNLYSKRLQNSLESEWNRGLVQCKGHTNHSLLIASLLALKGPLLSVIPPRACLVALNFCQPLLLNRALSLSVAQVTRDSTNVGYGLIGAYILVYIGIAISMGQYQHLTYRAITMLRGGLISIIYKKSSTLAVKDVDPAASLTLMSADIERIVQGWQTMNEIWANAAEIGLAIFLLERQLGTACVIPVAVSVFALVGSLAGLSFVMLRQALWLEAIERRISSTTSMLSSIKGVKMLGLTESLMTRVHGLRIAELDISKGFRRLLVWNMGFAWLTRIFAPVFTFGIFVAISRHTGREPSVSVSRVYTSLSLFALLADPLLSLVMALLAFVGSVGSFARIQEFLQKESHKDHRYRINHSLPDGTIEESKMALLLGSSDSASNASNSSKSLEAIPFVPFDIVTVQGATFGWNPEEDPTLKNVTLAIPRASFTMIVGASGCGKSTLLKAVLGEIPCLSGRVSLLSDRVAYCDQTPWHMNGTIQESIVAMSELDEAWYTSVIRACALEEDFRQLPRGDKTIIGSKGIALSGGQSQRVALARAVYARRDVILLDDVLSGLDAATENYIFHNLISFEGLLRQAGSTIILASSSVKRLPFADQIVVLDHDGHVLEQGRFNDLNRAGGYVSSFAFGQPELDSKPADLSSSDHPSTGPGFIEKTKDEKEERHDSKSDMTIYLYYIRAIGWPSALFFITAITGFAFCISFPSIWLKWWVKSGARDSSQHTGYYLGIYAMLGIAGMICLIASCWQMIITMVPRSGESFHRKLLSTVLSAPMLFFSTTESGSILNRFSQDLQLIDMELPIAAINFVAALVMSIAQMVLIGIASIYAAISFPIVLGVLYLVQKAYLRTSRQLRFLDLEAKAPLYTTFTDSLAGLVTLRAFGWQQSMEERNRQLLDRSQRPFYLLFAVQRWLTLVLDLVVAAIAIILIILVVTLRGTISAGYTGVALLNIILFGQTIKYLITFWTNLETHIGSVLRIKEFTESVQPEDLPSEDQPVPPEWPSKGLIEFRSVAAAYRPTETVLNGINLLIEPGEKIGICGRTGSGKTSLIMSIFRMIELVSGSIQIDGVDIARIPRKEIRSRINGVSQDPLLMEGSVRQNADPTGSHSDKAILKVLQSVQLLSAIKERGGLDTDIDSIFLSHGQKQLFCLARAILRPGNILVLDEATSNVDAKTDEIMQRVIREKFSDHTVLAVAHKLDTILDYDRIVVLDGGLIVESGKPFDLLASPDSHFSKLYANSMLEE